MGGYKKTFVGEGIWSLIGGWKYFKIGGLDKKGAEKNRGGCDPQRNYEAIIALIFFNYGNGTVINSWRGYIASNVFPKFCLH